MRSGITTAYTYNKRNRLATVTLGGNLKGTYTYNAREQLVKRVLTNMTPSGTTHFVHDLMGNVIAETNGVATGTVREYIWLPETEIAPVMDARAQVDRPLAVVDAVNTASPVTWWVTPDHLNRPVLMTDAAKAQVWQAVWKPFGEAQSLTGPAALDTRFPGQWFQIESGLHYNWHRHYDPTTGRYTQPDPLGFVDGPGVYGYVGGSTSALVDLDGQRIGPTIPLRPDLKPIPPAPNPLPIPKPKFWPEPKVPPYSPIPDGPSGARYIECGPYEIRIDNDPHKKKHAHWYRRKKKEGCIKVDGSPCDGSGPPPNRVRKCLEDDGFFNFIRQEACYVQ